MDGFVKEHVMPSVEGVEAYTSPPHKLLPFFKNSRDGWKEKCRRGKTDQKRLKNRVSSLCRSRDRWKELARQRKDELEELRQQFALQKRAAG
jgi:hypothetical protein